jgi:nickel/cobalt transporter (NiCoT) family protein
MLLAFALGTRHGLDADHLAAIDGMVRCNVERRPGFSRSIGALFSVGHGSVVVLAAVAGRGLPNNNS